MTARDLEALRTFGWPSLLPTRLACLYCSTSRRTLLRAVDAGDLSPVNKLGRSWIFDRVDLDAWMRGVQAEQDEPDVSPPKQYRTSADSREVAAALAKLRRISRS